MSDIARIQNIERETEKHSEALYGNGRPGLVTRVGQIETKLDDMPDIKKRLQRIEYAIYGAAGALTLAKFIFHL